MRLIEHTPKRWAEFCRTRNPITESIVPLDSRERRSWAKMNDRWLVSFAEWFMNELGLSGRNELSNANPSLYTSLRKRGLLDAVGFEEKLKAARNWESMGDEEIIEIAKRFVEQNEISGRHMLNKADPGLCAAVRKRGLFDILGFTRTQRSPRDWSRVSDDEIVELARRIVEDRGIVGRKEFRLVDRGLYRILWKRQLLDRAGLKTRGAVPRKWSHRSDKDLIEYARKFVEQNKIKGKNKLRAVDSGLYDVLWERKLLNAIGFTDGQRNWTSKNNDELIEMAQRFLGEMGITGRKEFERADNGLCSAIRRRGLLDQVFSQIERQAENNGIGEISDAMSEFGGEECD